MTSQPAPTFGAHNHPAGQIVVSSRRDVSARASALVGYRLDKTLGVTTVSRVHGDLADILAAAN